MFWTVLALALWVVLGGFISYYGDLQGRRWGKRRVSWFGLRPKHTAILITSLTGGFIALFSVASLMIIVPTVRDVVTHGENAIQENKRLIVGQKQQQLLVKLDRESALRAYQLKLQAGELNVQATNKKYADGQRSLAALQAHIVPLQARVAALQAHLDVLNTRIAAQEVQQRKLAATNKQLAINNATEDVINKQLATQNLEYGHQNVDLNKANSVAKVSNQEFYNSNVSLENEKNALEMQNSALERQKRSLEKEKHDLEIQVASLTNQREEVIDLIHQRDQLDSQIAQQYSVLLKGHVILGAGVELGRISTDAHLRPEAIKKQVGSLIASASEQAKRFGAAPNENGQAATLPLKPTPTLTGYENKSESAQIDSLAEEWSGSDTPNVVVATTMTNCLAGQPAYIALRRYPVVRVFAKGAEVASRTIDGHSKVDDIIQNLMSFLQKDVQKSALQAGSIPRVDPETGLSEVGVLGMGELFHLTDTVRRMRGPVLLTARAKHDVSSADRLDLVFKVSRLPSQPQAVATDY